MGITILGVEETEARIERGLGIYRQLLQRVLDDYNRMDENRWYARRANIAEDFDTDWEIRVHRNMTEQLRQELLEEVDILSKYTAGLERRVSKAGYEATNALPQPQDWSSSQQSNKVRNEAAKRLAALRREVS